MGVALVVGAGCGASSVPPASTTPEPSPFFTDSSASAAVTDPTPVPEAPEPAVPAAPPSVRAGTSLLAVNGGSKVGTVTFEQVGATVSVTGQFTGLTPGMHGFYVHSGGDCGGKLAGHAGLHFNPGNVKHGPIGAALRHVGDFGNLIVDKNGDAAFEMTTDSLTVTPGPDSVVGRAIVIHARKDDGTTQPSGSAGPAVACGVIGAPGQLSSRSVGDSARALWNYSLGR